MGTTIAKNSLAAQQMMYRLTVDCSCSNSGQAISISKLLSAELLNIRPRMRSMQMEKCLINVLNHLPENPLIKDIDVMFNPTYAVDVLQVLINTYKRKQYSLIWPGTLKDECLIYAEEGYRDYKTYNISDYDIVCLI